MDSSSATAVSSSTQNAVPTVLTGIRRHINDTFYARFYLDVEGVQARELNQPFDEFHAALALSKKTTVIPADSSTTSTTKQGPLSGASRRASGQRSSSGLALALADIHLDAGSSKTSLVELRGIEPLTFSMRTRRATNCAIAP